MDARRRGRRKSRDPDGNSGQRTARDDSTPVPDIRCRQAPGARPSSVQGPTAQRMRRSVGRPTAAVIRRTWRLRPFADGQFEPRRGNRLPAHANRRIARPQFRRAPASGAPAPGRVVPSVEVHAARQRGELRGRRRRLRPAPSRSSASLCFGSAMRACSAPSAVSTTQALAVGVEPPGRIDVRARRCSPSASGACRRRRTGRGRRRAC